MAGEAGRPDRSAVHGAVDNRDVQPFPRRALRLTFLLTLGLAATSTVPQTWELPALDRVINYQPKQPLQVFTADGVEIAQFGAERRQFVPIAQIPKLVQDAVIAIEDSRFREHSGIDPRGMARALLAMLTGGMRQGASTITQQVARTFFLSRELSAERKTKEIMLALKIEQALSKDKILELYMNEIFLGQRAYGFAAAAQVYFGKPLARLSIAEAAMLAGLPQNPHYANPVSNFDRATQRQRLVLERMRVTGVINDQQHAAARAEKLVIRSALQASVHAGHVAEMARLAVVERFGADAYSSGIKVHTSLRSSDQQAAWTALRKGVLDFDRKGAWRGPEAVETLPTDADATALERAAAKALKDHRDDEQLRVAIVLQVLPNAQPKVLPKALRVQLASGERVMLSGDALAWAAPGLAAKASAALRIRRGSVLRLRRLPGTGNEARWAIVQWPQAQAAFVALDPQTGRVRALVGGFDFSRQPFNHVTQGWRQPGSSFKPFLYSAALERGVMPATLIDDAPYTAANGWSPQNSDGRFDGPLSLREALVRSKNLVSVRLLQTVGIGPAREWAARFGLEATRHPDNLTFALGAGSTSPMQLAQAYAVLANGGWRVSPVVVERITDANGKVLFEAPPAAALSEESRAVPARNIFIINSLLRDVARVGTAARAQRELKRADVFGKTGTTNDAVDAWFAGFHPTVVAVAWMGYDDPRSLGERESGGGLALPIWIGYMARALERVPEFAAPAPPPGLLRAADDWLYAEWGEGGWITQIAADAAVSMAPLPAAIAASEGAAAVAPAGSAPR